VFEIWKGGVVAYGGFLGGFGATVVFCRLHRIALLPWLDCVAPTLCVGLVLTRIGCFLAGCDYGQPWDGPWAVHFPAGSIPYREQVLQGLLPAGAAQSLAVHPTQLYESLTGFVLLLVVIAVRRWRTSPGSAFISVVVGYAVLRSAIEVVRGDLGRSYVGMFSTSQVIALGTFVSAAVFIYLQRYRTIGAVRTDRHAAV
jgi:phosphatidylglycerol:prolipoprotein diacylglycerol transferase